MECEVQDVIESNEPVSLAQTTSTAPTATPTPVVSTDEL